MKYPHLLILCFILGLHFYSCNTNVASIPLPSSNFTNIDPQELSSNHLIEVHGLSDQKYKVIYRDTLVATLDSTLHTKILNLKQQNRQYHEYPSVLFSLDKNLSYKKFRELVTEFRKLNFQRIILKLDKEKYLRTYELPIQREENLYLDSRLKESYAPSFLKECKPYFKKDTYLQCSIENNSVVVRDAKGTLIPDYVNYASMQKELITFYTLKSEATYGDYVQLMSTILKMQQKIQERISEKSVMTTKWDKNDHTFILLEKSYLKHFQNNF